MAVIAATNVRAAGGAVKPLVMTTLTADDTLTYDPTRRQVLVLRNPTAGAITATIDGDGATTQDVPGTGGAMNLAGGLSTGSIAAGAGVVIELDAIKSYLTGVVHVTGGTGLVAEFLSF